MNNKAKFTRLALIYISIVLTVGSFIAGLNVPYPYAYEPNNNTTALSTE